MLTPKKRLQALIKHRAYDCLAEVTGIPEETMKELKYGDLEPTEEQIELLALQLHTRASYIKGEESPCFSDWILERRITDTPIGDFVRDTIGNFYEFPKGVDGKRELIEGFLVRKMACKEAFEAFKVLWSRYEKDLKKQATLSAK